MSVQNLSLDVIQVEQPCPKSWEAMAGDERSRFCQGCGRHVVNLSAMTRSEAERVVCEAAGRLCVRFERSEAGVIQTLEYQPTTGRRGRGWKFWTVLSACLAAGVGAVNAAVFRSRLPPPIGPSRVTVGMMLPLPVTPTQNVSDPSCPVEDAASDPHEH
jgi:hypothetical protein